MDTNKGQKSYFTKTQHDSGVETIMETKDHSELEARVSRLEGALANLQDQTLLEERIASRLAVKFQRNGIPNPGEVSKATSATNTTSANGEEVVEVPGLNLYLAGKWFFNEIVPELRAMSCMFFDPRYKLGALNKALPAAIFLLIVLSGYWVPFSSLPVVGGLIDSIIMLCLGYFLIKILSAEARRYRQLAPGLPKSLRLPPNSKEE
ncbi:MAG: hypothetical protein RL179_104 [Planctomycetota bacterium]|jgi:hypothetical protein